MDDFSVLQMYVFCHLVIAAANPFRSVLTTQLAHQPPLHLMSSGSLHY